MEAIIGVIIGAVITSAVALFIYFHGRPKRRGIDAVNWDQGPHNAAAGIHRLIVLRGGEKSIFTFTKYELLENHGSKE